MTPQTSYSLCQTRIGPLTLIIREQAIIGLHAGNIAPPEAVLSETDLSRLAVKQITQYFQGRRREFDLPLRPSGTIFQKQVWEALCQIPYGETRSYRQIAEAIGNPNACRAVGMANNKNPVMILIPCHRVIGADGSLTGYACGLGVKRMLLELEQSSLG